MIPAFLLRFAIGKVGERFAKPLSYLMMAFALFLVLAVAKCSYDRSVIKNYEAETSGKIIKTNAEAQGAAAEQRVNDTLSTQAAKDQRDDEIRKAPDRAPSAASVRLGCERLRRAGKDTSGLAPCAGLEGPAKAPADR